MPKQGFWHNLGFSPHPNPSGASNSMRKEVEISQQPQSTESGSQEDTRRILAKIYFVGTSTLELYFRHQLSGESESGGPPGDSTDQSFTRNNEDLFREALDILRPTTDLALPSADFLIPVLTRCVTQTIDGIKAADEFMEISCGVSALKTPALHQLLVALAAKHRNLGLVTQLLHMGSIPDRHVFRVIDSKQMREGSFSQLFEDPEFANKVWSELTAAKWVDRPIPADAGPSAGPSALPAVDPEAGLEIVRKAVALVPTDPNLALKSLTELFSSGYQPSYYTGTTLDLLVGSGTALMLLRFLPLVSRTLYDGIPPHPRWPGAERLVTSAAARSGEAHGLGITKVLVEIGGMDINVSAWYKRGSESETKYSWDARLPDGSCADETPLHAAVHHAASGDAALVRYLLSKGAKRVKDAWGRDALERAIWLGKLDLVTTFEEYGWTVT